VAKKTVTSDKIKLKEVRLSFARLFKAKAYEEGQEPRYEATFLLDPTLEAHKASIAEIDAAGRKIAKAKWGDDEDYEDLVHGYGYSNNNKVKKKYDGYKDMFYVVCANTEKPQVFPRNKRVNDKGELVWQTVLEGDKEAPYSGCYVNTTITLWTQDNKFGKGIRANLRIVQFAKPGTPFSGAAPANPDDEIEAYGDGVASDSDLD